MEAWQPMLHELAGPRYARLVAHAATLAGDRAAAEDLVQDALVRTFSRPRHFDSVHQAERYVRLAIASAFIGRTRWAETRRTRRLGWTAGWSPRRKARRRSRAIALAKPYTATLDGSAR